MTWPITMIQDYFVTKSDCEFAIISQKVASETIARELELAPDRSFEKGEIISSEYSTRVGKKPHNLWAIKSEATISESQSISSHIIYLRSKLEDKFAILERYKKDPDLELIFSISIETEDVGFSFSLREEELDFINKICNRCDCFLRAKESTSF